MSSTFDAGVLLVWKDDARWAKFCFEMAPNREPMVVSVVTNDVSDDANAFVPGGNSISYRIARIAHVYAFHASTDGEHWRLVRVFSLGSDLTEHKVGFEVQSPTGDGCAVRFDDIAFERASLWNLRNGP